MSKKPSFYDYAKNKDKGMKDYVIDVLRWLESEGDERMKDFDFKMFDKLPDNIWNIEDISAVRSSMDEDVKGMFNKFLQMIIRDFGNDLWGDIFGDGIDLNNEDSLDSAIKDLRSKVKVKSRTGRSILGPLVKSNVTEANDTLDRIMDEAKDAVYACLQIGDDSFLVSFIATGKESLAEVIKDKPEYANSDGYKLLSEVILQAENILAISKLSDEQYNAFYNNLLRDFIDEEVDEGDVIEGIGSVQVLWRQVYSEELQETPVNGIATVLFDLRRKTVRPVVFCLHEALHNDIDEAFSEQVGEPIAQRFIMGGVMDFLNVHKDAAMKFVDAREISSDDDNSLFAANIRVSPEVQTPSGKLVADILTRISLETFLDDDSLGDIDVSTMFGKDEE